MCTPKSTILDPPQPVYVIGIKPVLSVRSVFIVAIATVHWSTFAGLKRYFSVLAALGTYCGEHLAWSVTVTASRSITLGLSCLATSKASLGLISVAFGLEELLLLGTKGKVSPTIGTLELFVLKTHWMTSSPLIVG